MAQYAYFDSTQAAPQPVLGWYDTDFVTYPALPPASDLLVLTAEQWTARTQGHWAVSAGTLIAVTLPVPAPSLEQQAAAALATGLAVTSANTPAISGLYAVDATAQSHLQVETMSILLNGTFADGGANLAWPDMAGVVHSFPSVAEFKTFATVVSAYVAALFKVINGTSTTLPPSTAAIA